MYNTKDLVKLCTELVCDDTQIKKLLLFNNRVKKEYLKKIKPIALFFISVILILVIVFKFLGTIINDFLPIIIIILIIFIIALLALGMYYVERYQKFAVKLKPARSIKITLDSYRLLYRHTEFVVDDKTMVVCFINDNNPIHKFEVALEYMNVEYDNLIVDHKYHFYAIDNRKIMIVDNVYDKLVNNKKM